MEFAEVPAFSRFVSLSNGVLRGGSAVFSGLPSLTGLRLPTPRRYLGSLQQSTVIGVGSTSIMGTANRCIFSERGTAGSAIYKIELTPNDTLSGRFTYRNDAGTLLSQFVSCPDFNDGRTVAISATKNGTAHRVGVNGAYSSGTFGSASSAFTEATLARQLGADAGDSTVPWHGPVDFVAGWARALSEAEVNAVSRNPWQLFKPIERRLWVASALVSLPTLVQPASTTSAGAWTATGAATLHAAINEATPSAAEYISVSSASTCELQLANSAHPGGATQTLAYRASSTLGSTLTVTLKQGVTTIMSRTHALTPTDTLYTQTLTSPEIALIAAGPISVTLASS